MRVLLSRLGILLVLLGQLPEQGLGVVRLFGCELVGSLRGESREEVEESLGDGEGRWEGGRVGVVGR